MWTDKLKTFFDKHSKDLDDYHTKTKKDETKMSEFLMTENQLYRILGIDNSDQWYSAMEVILPDYKINKPKRIASFIAQCYHESRGFTVFEENMNYSANRLLEVFGSRYFRNYSHASQYAYNPEKLANYVYADENRSSNSKLGNVYPGDGWKFRGHGIIQLTGRYNYEQYGKTIGKSAEEALEYVKTKQGAIESACWYWNEHNLNWHADRGDIKGQTLKINGGYHGLSDRVNLYEKALNVINDGNETSTPKYETEESIGDDFVQNIGIGDKGEMVKRIQRIVGTTDDGFFGPNTKRAVKKYQRENGLMVDGIVGKNTFAKMFG